MTSQRLAFKWVCREKSSVCVKGVYQRLIRRCWEHWRHLSYIRLSCLTQSKLSSLVSPYRLSVKCDGIRGCSWVHWSWVLVFAKVEQGVGMMVQLKRLLGEEEEENMLYFEWATGNRAPTAHLLAAYPWHATYERKCQDFRTRSFLGHHVSILSLFVGPFLDKHIILT